MFLMPDNFIFTDFGAIPDFASELSRLSAVFGDRIKKLINFEPGNENSIRISLLNYDFEVNLTYLHY